MIVTVAAMTKPRLFIGQCPDVQRHPIRRATGRHAALAGASARGGVDRRARRGAVRTAMYAADGERRLAPRPEIDVQPMSEDCLYLNVWTAAGSSPERRPVIVWAHGGSFIVGAGSWPEFDGEMLARKGVHHPPQLLRTARRSSRDRDQESGAVRDRATTEQAAGARG